MSTLPIKEYTKHRIIDVRTERTFDGLPSMTEKSFYEGYRSYNGRVSSTSYSSFIYLFTYLGISFPPFLPPSYLLTYLPTYILPTYPFVDLFTYFGKFCLTPS